LIELLGKIPNTTERQEQLCCEVIEWCRAEKRTFLRQRVETKLAALYLNDQKYTASLELLRTVVQEVKKLDDKLLLVEIHILETKTHFMTQNIPRCKASLTSAKTNANAIHCPPLLQADIDLWSGIIAAHEHDGQTAYSYFYEAFEGFDLQGDSRALMSFQYMLLAKILIGEPDSVETLTSSKAGLKHLGVEVEAMVAVAKAHKNRSLKEFESVLSQYGPQLTDNAIIQRHISHLNEGLFEQNLLRILEPFCRVELAHVAKLIELPETRVTQKLGEMILDSKLSGTLDQGVGVIIVFDKEPIRSTYANSLECIKNTSGVIDKLTEKAKLLV
jgi:26S proteasome regulatory subunit N6